MPMPVSQNAVGTEAGMSERQRVTGLRVVLLPKKLTFKVRRNRKSKS